METIKPIGRSSRLSLLQIDIIKRKIQNSFPDLKVEVIARTSKGNALQNFPLHTIERRYKQRTFLVQINLLRLIGTIQEILFLMQRRMQNSGLIKWNIKS